MPDSESSEQTERGSDELLLEIVSEQEIMALVEDDDAKRMFEEQRVSSKPSIGDG